MAMSQGTPFWQAMLFVAALLFILWETWRGWRAGVIRSGIALAAIVFSGLAGYAAARLAAIPFGGFEGFSGALVGLGVGGAVAVAVFLFIWLVGVLLFKRTEQQRGGLLRLLWGAGGAVMGLLIGVFLVWSGISVVRSLGALAEAKVEPAATAGKSPSSLAVGLVTLKDSLELGPAGKFVSAIDPVQPEIYELIAQIGKLSGNQEAMFRFIQSPGIQEVIQSPRMVELINEPSVIRAAESWDFMALMSNPALREALEDPEFVKELKNVDLKSALQYAVEAPAPAEEGANE